MTTEISTKENDSVDGLIQQAIKSNVPVESLEKLLAMRDALRKEKARDAFVNALSNFQKECPIIEKTKKVMNKDGTTVRYKYAPIDSIVEQIKNPLGKSELAYTWTVKNETGKITATCKITHVLGHYEESSFEIPIGASEYMTAPQAVASALTFAKRYSLCNALGISTGDEDTDATNVNKEKEPKSDKSKIVFLLKKLGQDVSSAESIKESIKNLTKIERTSDHKEIIARLEILISEQNENPKI